MKDLKKNKKTGHKHYNYIFLVKAPEDVDEIAAARDLIRSFLQKRPDLDRNAFFTIQSQYLKC